MLGLNFFVLSAINGGDPKTIYVIDYTMIDVIASIKNNRVIYRPKKKGCKASALRATYLNEQQNKTPAAVQMNLFILPSKK